MTASCLASLKNIDVFATNWCNSPQTYHRAVNEDTALTDKCSGDKSDVWDSFKNKIEFHVYLCTVKDVLPKIICD